MYRITLVFCIFSLASQHCFFFFFFVFSISGLSVCPSLLTTCLVPFACVYPEILLLPVMIYSVFLSPFHFTHILLKQARHSGAGDSEKFAAYAAMKSCHFRVFVSGSGPVRCTAFFFFLFFFFTFLLLQQTRPTVGVRRRGLMG